MITHDLTTLGDIEKGACVKDAGSKLTQNHESMLNVKLNQPLNPI